MEKIGNKLTLVLLLVAALAIASCSPKTYKDINYFQDARVDTTMAMKVNKGIQIQPQDKISIVVSTRDPELSRMFNLMTASVRATSESNTSTSHQIIGYVVDNNGEIDFPILGKIYVAGMTRWELSEYIKTELADQKLLKDAVVSVDFMNFKFTVLGEVSKPGTYGVTSDRITILQALSMAGDLTIHGVRHNVSVIREQGRKRQVYLLDLTSSDIFNSPAYYLQQSDVVYVEPDHVRAGQSTINENTFKSVGFWTSFSSFIMSTANMVLLLRARISNL